MAGQSAHLSLKEAREMQCRIQHSESHAHNHGSGPKGSYNGKKKPEVGKKHDVAEAHNN